MTSKQIEELTLVPEMMVPQSPNVSTVVEVSKPKARTVVMDLRIHSPMSLGYLAIEGIDTAPALVRLAKVKGLDVIGMTDFYGGQFIDRVVEAAKSSQITIVPGFVIRTRFESCNDVVLVALFPESYNGAEIERILRALKVPESVRGDRCYVLETPLQNILNTIEDNGGVVLPSRMDKTPNRLAVVPALVDRFGFRAFDLAYADTGKFFKARWPKTKFHLFSFSNANALAQVGNRIARVKISEPGFSGIKSLIAREKSLKVTSE